MKKSEMSRFFVVAWVAAFLILEVSCTTKPVKKEESLLSEVTHPVSMPEGADENTLGDSDSGKAVGIQTVNFAYDSSALDASNESVLRKNAEILKEHSNLKIQVEGHCDQRGGVQYNIALGERRAKVVKNFLKNLGVSESRLTGISFGK
jgi:peptidoglycan-associated lipoprotein